MVLKVGPRLSIFSFGALVALNVFSVPAQAASREFVIDDAGGRDLVSFTSDAPIELIVGRTSKIDGKISVDDSLDLSKTPLNAVFNVDLASIDTGIPLRNEHMRDNFLQTAKYPKAQFKLNRIVSGPKKLQDGKKATLKCEGDFSLHGKTVKKVVSVDLIYMKKCPATESKVKGCDIIQLKSTFNVPFKDHGISRPEVVFQKLADTVIVTISATAASKTK